MIYKILFYCLISFYLGRLSKGFKFYMGHDEAQYKAATIGILLR